MNQSSPTNADSRLHNPDNLLAEKKNDDSDTSQGVGSDDLVLGVKNPSTETFPGLLPDSVVHAPPGSDATLHNQENSEKKNDATHASQGARPGAPASEAKNSSNKMFPEVHPDSVAHVPSSSANFRLHNQDDVKTKTNDTSQSALWARPDALASDTWIHFDSFPRLVPDSMAPTCTDSGLNYQEDLIAQKKYYASPSSASEARPGTNASGPPFVTSVKSTNLRETSFVDDGCPPLKHPKLSSLDRHQKSGGTPPEHLQKNQHKGGVGPANFSTSIPPEDHHWPNEVFNERRNRGGAPPHNEGPVHQEPGAVRVRGPGWEEDEHSDTFETVMGTDAETAPDLEKQDTSDTAEVVVPEATLVEEEEPSNQVNEGNWWSKKRRRWVLIMTALLAVTLVAIGVLLGLVVPRENSSEGSAGEEIAVPEIPTLSPTSPAPATAPPTLSPTSSPILDGLREVLASASRSSLPSLLNTSTAQYQALEWLSNNKDVSSYTDERLVQRWVLATLYFSADGDNWTEKDGWLTDDNECSWYNQAAEFNSTCDDKNRIFQLDLATNGLEGTTPMELSLLSNSLSFLDFGENKIGGFIPTEIGLLKNLEALGYFGNALVGNLPSQFGALTKMNDMHLASNSLTGSIPTEFGQMTALNRRLFLFENRLSGSVPSEVGLLTNLGQLSLRNNELSGVIPTEIGLLKKLDSMQLSTNKIVGTIATEIGLLSNLAGQLSLRTNSLTGSVPSEIALLTKVDELFLHENELVFFPTVIGMMTGLEILALFQNSFAGPMPSEIGLLAKLRELYLHVNNFTGTIPSTLGMLTNLEDFFLSTNSISGPIPSELGLLTKLSRLELWGTDLVGPVPDQVCALTGSSLASFVADCEEISCTCCTSCF